LTEDTTQGEPHHSPLFTRNPGAGKSTDQQKPAWSSLEAGVEEAEVNGDARIAHHPDSDSADARLGRNESG